MYSLLKCAADLPKVPKGAKDGQAAASGPPSCPAPGGGRAPHAHHALGHQHVVQPHQLRVGRVLNQ